MDSISSKVKAQDRIYPSDNEFEIPSLLPEYQPKSGLLLPFSGWGITPRLKKGIATYHFYVDDYRFENVWHRPERIIKSGCSEVVEPNFSLFQTTPIAYGLHLIYKKRWIARWLQECGVRVYADLNVAPKFRELNKLGIPEGYNAFATRGNADCTDNLKEEHRIACEISGSDNPNLIVYGGGKAVQSYCRQKGLLFIPDYMTQRREEPWKEVRNG